MILCIEATYGVFQHQLLQLGRSVWTVNPACDLSTSPITGVPPMNGKGQDKQ